MFGLFVLRGVVDPILVGSMSAESYGFKFVLLPWSSRHSQQLHRARNGSSIIRDRSKYAMSVVVNNGTLRSLPPVILGLNKRDWSIGGKLRQSRLERVRQVDHRIVERTLDRE